MSIFHLVTQAARSFLLDQKKKMEARSTQTGAAPSRGDSAKGSKGPAASKGPKWKRFTGWNISIVHLLRQIFLKNSGNVMRNSSRSFQNLWDSEYENLGNILKNIYVSKRYHTLCGRSWIFYKSWLLSWTLGKNRSEFSKIMQKSFQMKEFRDGVRMIM